MKVITPGHNYKLDTITGECEQYLHFFKTNKNSKNEDGVLNQEVLRVLIDRIHFLENELPWNRNNEILFHLRKALLLHEIRALERKLEKGTLDPEKISLDLDGHFKLLKLK